MSKKKVLSKYMILCWATFIAILGRMRPRGHGLDTLVRKLVAKVLRELKGQTGESGSTQRLITARSPYYTHG